MIRLARKTGSKAAAVNHRLYDAALEAAKIHTKTAEGVRFLAGLVRKDINNTRGRTALHDALAFSAATDSQLAMDVMLDPEKRDIASRTFDDDGMSAAVCGECSKVSAALLLTEGGISFLRFNYTSGPYGGGTLMEVFERIRKTKEALGVDIATDANPSESHDGGGP